MLRIAYEDEKLQNVPVIRLPTAPPARKGFLAPEKFAELLGMLPTHLRPLVMFLYWCGVRLGEARAIDRSAAYPVARRPNQKRRSQKCAGARCSCHAFEGHEAQNWSRV